MTTAAVPARWDIFCSVVDNYGDIGVAWRLGRQLAAERGIAARLYIDDPAALARIAPEIDARAGRQSVRGVEVRAWDRSQDAKSSVPGEGVGEVVIEAFGCGLPSGHLDAMCARSPAPVWINLEYLTAEAWIEGCHGLASPQPQRPLTRHFYFPGFTAGSGGLLREHGLLDRRDAFRADSAAPASLWHSLRVATPPAAALAVSLFCYADAPVAPLLDTWSAGDRAIVCIVPEGVAGAAIDRWAGRAMRQGDAQRRGALMLQCVPFVAQDGYDRLLWSCDLNFVRGEDSFVRAQWAACPMVWQPYPQAEGAHLAKLDAFLARYCAGLPPNAAAALSTFMRGWSAGRVDAVAWGTLLAAHPTLAAHARAWAAGLAAQDDLATRLAEFASDRV